eukprot:CAMPEP_0173176554 /NCGR_PEP_ID=MMETSP1141-20130122/4518_1 /TAXON_ID=483371 /ORGANISM="non described non described, Strain CCMP2298" /LENGTH=113 /DNA_ID=CAMNT_0014098893 /DNA_START=35 /DNA_END=376 /DNA_ORIENTATION=-
MSIESTCPYKSLPCAVQKPPLRQSLQPHLRGLAGAPADRLVVLLQHQHVPHCGAQTRVVQGQIGALPSQGPCIVCGGQQPRGERAQRCHDPAEQHGQPYALWRGVGRTPRPQQ